MKVIYEIVPSWPLVVMIIPSSGGNGFGSTVAMRSLSPKKGLLVAFQAQCYYTRVLRHQSATSAPKWCHQHDALLVAHRSMGGGWRNTKGLREEMEMVILKKYKR